MSNLTLDILVSWKQKIEPLSLYYATDKNVARGNCFLMAKGDYNPNMVVCHPDDFEALKNGLGDAVIFKHVSEEPMDAKTDRMAETIRKNFPLRVLSGIIRNDGA